MTVVARTAVCGAVAAWAGVGGWWPVPLVFLALALLRPRLVEPAASATFGVVFVVGSIVGAVHGAAPEPIPAGPVDLDGRVQVDLGGRWGWSGIVATPQGAVLVRADDPPPDDHVRISGVADGRTSQVVGRWVVSTVEADELGSSSSRSAHDLVADGLQRRILSEIRPGESTARGLLVGFLIGDTAGVSPVVVDEMRRAGLSHLVAVSGSNVALFLVGLIVVTAPLAMRPTGRLLIVLNGVLVFGALTRWEPSVLRASLMAAVVSLGRFVGVPLEPVTALAVVSGGSVLVKPELLGSVGFQLSVLATAGLMVGARLQPTAGRVATALTATIAAQLAVAPLLLVVFGAVPLLSPLANLVAIPLVTLATAVAGIGATLGFEWLVVCAEWLAECFVVVARVAAPWPQLDPGAFFAVVAAATACWRWRRLRPIGIVTAAVIVALGMVPAREAPATGLVVFDVGQGDSILVRLAGFTVLVDGGPDPAVLAARLTEYGVRRIDLVVATHVHEDHVAGLAGILERVPVGRIWAAFEPHETASSRKLLAQAARYGVPIERPNVGDTVALGSDRIEVVGPRRRYLGPNDQSIVLTVAIDGTTILLSGDIETVAQAELEVAGVDVLKVPHQGAATSEDGWLTAHAGSLAVVSVGPNDFGHPAEWVLATLRAAGAEVIRTDLAGDVVLDFDGGLPPELRTSRSG